MRKQILCIIWLCGLWWQSTTAQKALIDDPMAALAALRQRQESVLTDEFPEFPVQSLHRMMKLGMWSQVESILDTIAIASASKDLLRAELAFLNNDFFLADSLAKSSLRRRGDMRAAQYLMIQLHIQAWRLEAAERICLDLLNQQQQDEEAIFLLGRIHMHRKNYQRALALADQLIFWNELNPKGHLLRAEVLLWQRDRLQAEVALRRTIEIDPFQPDARFYYGYAIWRKVDATLLDQMAGQWEVSLAVQPLHFLTHWHWGNGHTHLTFLDYQDPDEAVILEELAPIEQQITSGQIDLALEALTRLEARYFSSVLPSMLKASAYYMSPGHDTDEKLNQAEAIFRAILAKKPHYGPAHNGLAAVIKQKRFAFLNQAAGLNRQIQQTEIGDPEHFYQVFDDVAQYPGDQVDRMVWAQLHSGVAYLPLLARLGRTFTIPPLHIDLARAMDNPFFRQATTFDNRQWMDIRGVGSGATGIEYVQRGAHLERNVTLHEYVHLFHLNVFTAKENRRVRALYHQAMKEKRTLDYYSANNEHEYLAQTYTAYFHPVKVHPLNHKSVNTTTDLKTKDPALYAFIDSLVQRQNAFINGKNAAFASNWAQAYVLLAAEEQNANRALVLLDTALQWDKDYAPAYFAKAKSLIKKGALSEAGTWLDQARQRFPYNPSLRLVRAEWYKERQAQGEISLEESIRNQQSALRQAEELAVDLALKAEINQQIRQFFIQNAQLHHAIDQAQQYVARAPNWSTYLRDKRESASAFIHEWKGKWGYTDEAEAFFTKLIAQNPQNQHYRRQFAEVLAASGKYRQAVEVLASSQLLQEASGKLNPAFQARMVSYSLLAGDTLKAKKLFRVIAEDSLPESGDPFVWVDMYITMDNTQAAWNRLNRMGRPWYAEPLSRWHHARGKLYRRAGREDLAQLELSAAIEANPYEGACRLVVLDMLYEQGKTRQARKLAERGSLLPLPPGEQLATKFQSFSQ